MRVWRRVVVTSVLVSVVLLGVPAAGRAAVTPVVTVSGPATAAAGEAMTLAGTLVADQPG